MVPLKDLWFVVQNAQFFINSFISIERGSLNRKRIHVLRPDKIHSATAFQVGSIQRQTRYTLMIWSISPGCQMKFIVVEELSFKTVIWIFDVVIIITFGIQSDQIYFISCFYLLIYFKPLGLTRRPGMWLSTCQTKTDKWYILRSVFWTQSNVDQDQIFVSV
jgi:hypothetical protein